MIRPLPLRTSVDLILIMANTAATIGAKIQTDHAEDGLDEDCYYLRKSDAKKLSNAEWLLLGQYIATNNDIKKLKLSSRNMTNAKMKALFKGLTGSNVLKSLDLSKNEFGVESQLNEMIAE